MPVGATSSWRSTIAYSALETTRISNRLDLDFNATPFERDTLEESKLSIHTSWNTRLSEKVRLQIGGAATLMDFRVFSSGQNSASFSGEGDGWLLRPYANLRYLLAPKLELLGGLQYSYFTFNGTSAFEPRVSLRYTKNNQEFSLAYGLHSKLQPTQLYFLEDADGAAANRDLEFSKAHHLVLAHQVTTGPSTRLKTEIYFQRLFNIPEFSLLGGTYSVLNWEEAFIPKLGELSNTGTGVNYGLEVSWQHFITDGYYYLLNGTLFESKYTDGDVQRNTRFNSNYLLNLTGGKEFVKEKEGSQRTWGINLRISYVGGFWESPIDETASALAGTTVLDFSQANTIKQPDIFKVDSRFYFRKNRKKSSSTIALDLQNMTNRQNLAYRYFDVFQGRILDVNQLGIIPNLSWRIEF